MSKGNAVVCTLLPRDRAGVEHALKVGLLHHFHPALLRVGPDAAALPRLPGGRLEGAPGGALQPPCRPLGTLLLVSSRLNVRHGPSPHVTCRERVACRFLPESARWLLTQRRREEAKRELHRAARVNGRKLAEDLLDKVSAAGARPLAPPSPGSQAPHVQVSACVLVLRAGRVGRPLQEGEPAGRLPNLVLEEACRPHVTDLVRSCDLTFTFLTLNH